MSNKPYRVVIIEPSPIVQQGLCAIIQSYNNFEVVSSLYDMHRMEERLIGMRPDLVILNPALIDYHRRGSIKSLFPDVILLSLVYNYIDNEVLKQFSGIIDIYDTPSKIEVKLREIMVAHLSDEVISDGSDLSEREKEILIAVAKGMINKEIASLHHISIHTVISHRKNISRKTGIKSVSGLTVYALLNNLIEQNEIQ